MVHAGLLLLFPPLLPGLIAKTKAWCAGRKGAPLLQSYFDLWKLLHKDVVYSRTTTWVFRAGAFVPLATAICAGLLLPLHAARAPLGFSGDVIVFAYLLALGRFSLMAAALDTGSSFEGMGASREAAFAALAEPALFLALAIICVPARTISFEPAWQSLPWESWGAAHPAYLATAVALFMVLLAENSRIPVDDPSTHLELTMIHEAMVLDYSGPDLAFVLYGAAVKLFVLGSLLVHLLLPIPPDGGWSGLAIFSVGQMALALAVGIVESVMARLRLSTVPEFLVSASVIAAIGLATVFYRGAP
jgi:formate hydrogenlyase subunit 4